jgi:hypothetical protein
LQIIPGARSASSSTALETALSKATLFDTARLLARCTNSPSIDMVEVFQAFNFRAWGFPQH